MELSLKAEQKIHEVLNAIAFAVQVEGHCSAAETAVVHVEARIAIHRALAGPGFLITRAITQSLRRDTESDDALKDSRLWGRL